MPVGIPFSYSRPLFAKPRTGDDLLNWAANRCLKRWHRSFLAACLSYLCISPAFAHSSYAIAEEDLALDIFGSFLLMLQALPLIASLLAIWFSRRYAMHWHAVAGWPHAPATESSFNSSHTDIRSGGPGKPIPTKYIQIVCNLGFPATQIPVISSAAVAAGGL